MMPPLLVPIGREMLMLRAPDRLVMLVRQLEMVTLAMTAPLSDHPGVSLHFPPFWCLDAKGGESLRGFAFMFSMCFHLLLWICIWFSWSWTLFAYVREPISLLYAMLNYCKRLWISVFGSIYGWVYIILCVNVIVNISFTQGMILLSKSQPICVCHVIISCWVCFPFYMCFCISRQIKDVHIFRGSPFSWSSVMFYCKSECCHLTPKRGRLKEHLPSPLCFVC